MSEVIKVQNLKKYFKTVKGFLHAVDDVSFTIKEGTTLGVVGESGCGKSTLGRTILKLLDETSGSVYFDGIDLTKLTAEELRKIRKEMQLIFQDPYSSLNPRKTVAQIISQPINIHFPKLTKQEKTNKIRKVMDIVGLSERLYNSYPHELDGGRRQRVGIARALVVNPKFIVCDEPVSSLDVSIQAQILNLLNKLQKKYQLTYLFITHDLSVVKYISDEIIVMYLGKIIEKAKSKELFKNPKHPYTIALLSAILKPKLHLNEKRIVLKGEITSPINPKEGCRFAKRCPECFEKCISDTPKLQDIGDSHYIACHLYD